jgi:nucleotide-binding universal stress UspA family protein
VVPVVGAKDAKRPIRPSRVLPRRPPQEAALSELVAFVRANQFDLVAMGTRGRTGWTRMRVGSTVAALLQAGSANLLIAHVPGRERSWAR